MSRLIVSAALAIAGALIGELTRRRLARGTHRRHSTDERRPPPSPHLWVPAMTSAALFGLGWTFVPELLNVASKGGLGLGDVKAGALIGLLAGATSLRSVWLVGMLTFLGALIFVGVSRRRQAVPLGPFLYGAWLIVTVTQGIP